MGRRRQRHVFLSCGEASGDRYGARLVAALRERDGNLRFSALGGPLLGAQNVPIIQNASDLAVMGVGEVVRSLPGVLGARRRMRAHLARENVDLFVPIDFPGFNGSLAARARSLGIPVFWLIAPQLWAWGAWRARRFRARMDRLGTILPFETDYFRARGFDVFPMGHPLMDDYGKGFPFEESLARREAALNRREGALTIGLLPGSRRQEIDTLLPILKVTSQTIVAHLGSRAARFVVSLAPGVDKAAVSARYTAAAEFSDEPLSKLLPRLDLALVCSGTASLEASLAGVPHEIVYRTGALTAFVGRRVLKVPHVGLASLILDRSVVREHLQEDASPLPLAGGLLTWLARPSDRQAFYGDVRLLRQLCGGAGVWGRTADAMLEFLARGAEPVQRPGDGT